MSDAKTERARADALQQAIAGADVPAPVARNVLTMQLDRGRMAEIAMPMDLTEVEALQILGALPQWMLAARIDYLNKTAGGRLEVARTLPS